MPAPSFPFGDVLLSRSNVQTGVVIKPEATGNGGGSHDRLITAESMYEDRA